LHVRLSLSEITSLFALSRYLDRTFALAIGWAKVKSKSEVTQYNLTLLFVIGMFVLYVRVQLRKQAEEELRSLRSDLSNKRARVRALQQLGVVTSPGDLTTPRATPRGHLPHSPRSPQRPPPPPAGRA